MSLPGFAFVTPFILSQAERGGWFKHMSLPGFPSVSTHPIARCKGRVVLTYVSTWLSPCHSIYLIAR